MIDVSHLNVGYSKKIIVKDFNMTVNKGEVTTLIGPNGSGKSTILKTVARFIKEQSGCILLDGINISQMDRKQLARKMACLSQYNTSPEDTTIRELVSFGRNPHKKWYERLSKEDDEVIDWAIKCANLSAMQHKRVVNLSGGERQRSWIAMSLAQKPEVLLLDEPTTYLDINNQIEILELVKELNKTMGLTVVMVLHDLNQAAKYSDNIYVLKNGKLAAKGKPREVLTRAIIRDVYKVEMDIIKHESGEELIFIPIRALKQA